MNKILKLDNLIYLSIYIFLTFIVSIYFYDQWYSDLNDFLWFFNLFSLWIVWELLIWKLNYNNTELLLLILWNLAFIFLLISYIWNKVSIKNMYFIIIFLSLFSILLWIFFLYLWIYG
jgi:hypothetical protein